MPQIKDSVVGKPTGHASSSQAVGAPAFLTLLYRLWGVQRGAVPPLCYAVSGTRTVVEPDAQDAVPAPP